MIFFYLICLPSIKAFYLPGIVMKDYANGDPVQVLANKLTSPSNTLPYPYYSIPVCRPSEKVRSRAVNLGQVLVGERAFPTVFNILMMRDEKCKVACTIDTAKEKTPTMKLMIRIRQGYTARLNADNMPLVTRYTTNSGHMAYRFGHALGYTNEDKTYVNNHLKLKVLYHQPSLSTGEALDTLTAERDTSRIVGFEVEPVSIQHRINENGQLDPESCMKPQGAQELNLSSRITYTYDVEFVRSDLAWATRWDPILNANAEIKQIQWFSIVNSLMVSLFLTALVATVMLRTILKDFGRYNAIEEDEDEDDLTGWKYVHGDVFRAPKGAAFLSICVGSGAQVLVMALFTQVFALVGFLSPANRGGLLTALLSLWVLVSSVSGYVSARVYSCIDTGVPRKMITFGTALLFPGVTFGIFFLLNLAMWTQGSSGSVPFTTLILLLFMWFGISVPLVFVGSYFGFLQKPIEVPTRINQIKRQIPPSSFGISPFVYSTLAGILPFGTVFMELVFILNSVWSGSVYYLYGALVSVFSILIVTCAEMSIVSTYLSLSAEDWASHWHTSFWGSGSAGFYVFLYSLYFALAQPKNQEIPFVSQIVFIAWSLIVSGAFALMCGAVGFFSSFWFTRKIYASIRID